MEPLKIISSIDTPAVLLDAANNVFELSGKSYPEDTVEFYTTVLKWMDAYAAQPNAQTIFIFKLKYFNSSSYKPIYDILTKLAGIKEKGFEVTVNWFYKSGDNDMKSAGEEFAELVNVPFIFSSM